MRTFWKGPLCFAPLHGSGNHGIFLTSTLTPIFKGLCFYAAKTPTAIPQQHFPGSGRVELMRWKQPLTELSQSKLKDFLSHPTNKQTKERKTPC